jgi:hypothetical protein
MKIPTDADTTEKNDRVCILDCQPLRKYFSIPIL